MERYNNSTNYNCNPIFILLFIGIFLKNLMRNRGEYDEQAKLLAKKIKKLRKYNKLTQIEMGEKCGFSSQYISNIENGSPNFKIESFIKIASVFKLELANFFDLEVARSFAFEYWKLPIQERFSIEKHALGKRIFQLSDHRGLDLLSLSVLAKIDYSDLFKYMNGEENILLTTVFKLAKGLEVELIDLFDYTGPLPDNRIFVGKTK